MRVITGISLLALSTGAALAAWNVRPTPNKIQKSKAKISQQLTDTFLAMRLKDATPEEAAKLQKLPQSGGCLSYVDPKAPNVQTMMAVEKTIVRGNISGFGARVTVTQIFVNPSTTPIEAVYTFPLPADAAVDSMRMRVSDRLIQGEIKPRDEARVIYETAKNQGKAAALLDQERPNIFTQSVANILPKARIAIEISYVQTLKYDAGEYEFNFPMVVGPRFLGNAPDPQKIAPPVSKTRTGNTVDLQLNIDAGARIQDLKSVLHEVKTNVTSASTMNVTLKPKDSIPNKDFILRYRVATDDVQHSFLTHFDPSKGGFFSLALIPPKRPSERQISPKEVIFVMDQSGSQSGFPIEKSKELTLKLIKKLRPNDTFNVMGFNTVVKTLWSKPQPNTPEHLREAEEFVRGMSANGGTYVREGVVASLAGTPDPKRLRIVLFNTDGYVGDETLILQTLKERRNAARMFTFGIGNSVNRYLIDGMSEVGRGAAEYVTLAESADRAVDRFVKRLETPVLTDVSATFEGRDITDQLPLAIPDVFDETPIVINGRYQNPGPGKLTLRGKLGGKPWSQQIDLRFGSGQENPAIMALWARRKVDSLGSSATMVEDLKGKVESLPKAIEKLGLDFHIMTQYTSFVAVEQKIINLNGKPTLVRVPVEKVEGLDYSAMDLSRGTIATGGQFGLVPGGGGRGGAIGGGGFGGPANAAPPALAVKALPAKAKSPMRDESERMISEKKSPSKIASTLKQGEEVQTIQILCTKVDKELIEKLKKLGLTIDFEDSKLKVVIGRIKGKLLAKIAEIEAVTRIEPVKK